MPHMAQFLQKQRVSLKKAIMARTKPTTGTQSAKTKNTMRIAGIKSQIKTKSRSSAIKQDVKAQLHTFKMPYKGTDGKVHNRITHVPYDNLEIRNFSCGENGARVKYIKANGQVIGKVRCNDQYRGPTSFAKFYGSHYQKLIDKEILTEQPVERIYKNGKKRTTMMHRIPPKGSAKHKQLMDMYEAWKPKRSL